jgi:hypothetical protein
MIALAVVVGKTMITESKSMNLKAAATTSDTRKIGVHSHRRVALLPSHLNSD